jgi:hypothetical protein
MSILASVTEIEDRVVDTVRTLQQPVVEYVRKGVERAEGRLPKLSYPENLPRPGEVVETQFNFAKALLDSQRDFVNELVDAVSPLVRPETGSATTSASAPEAPAPAPKTQARPAKKTGPSKS